MMKVPEYFQLQLGVIKGVEGRLIILAGILKTAWLRSCCTYTELAV
uniref:Uncharacterized protein n=1 Tax=Anguilla anguilla TaxID=7936 RepID=A0A0E9WVS4_ANGAN